MGSSRILYKNTLNSAAFITKIIHVNYLNIYGATSSDLKNSFCQTSLVSFSNSLSYITM